MLPSALERQCWCVCRVDVCHEQALLVEKHVCISVGVSACVRCLKTLSPDCVTVKQLSVPLHSTNLSVCVCVCIAAPHSHHGIADDC